MTKTYNSRFLKADTRAEQSQPGVSILSTRFSEGAIISDITLEAGAATTIMPIAGTLNFIIPIAGGAAIATNGKEINLPAEEVYSNYTSPESAIVVSNPFRVATINVIHVSLDKAVHIVTKPIADISALGIRSKNCLVQGSGIASRIRVGVYDSRTKDRIALDEGYNAAFTYIINGSFDFEERLMEYRDGLFQWDVHELEFEALAETSIVLIIACTQ